MREKKRADEPAGDIEVCEASINWDDEAECWVLAVMWMTTDRSYGDVSLVNLPRCEEVEQ